MGNDKKHKKRLLGVKSTETKETQKTIDKKNKQLKDFSKQWATEKLYLGYTPLEI